MQELEHPGLIPAYVLQRKMSSTQLPITGHFQVVAVKALTGWGAGEGVQLRVCLGTNEVTFSMFGTTDAACFTVESVNTRLCLSGSSKGVNVQHGKESTGRVCPTGGEAAKVSAYCREWASGVVAPFLGAADKEPHSATYWNASTVVSQIKSPTTQYP